MRFWQCLVDSATALKQTAVLTKAALLTAVYVLLHTFTTIVVTATMQIRFSPLALAVTGILYGPVVGAISGGIGDLIKCLIRPTGGFFFGFTFGEMVRGFLYGLILHNQKPTVLRVLLAVVCSKIVVDFFMTSLWLAMMGNGAYLVLLASRAVSVLIMIPVEFGLLYGSLKMMERTKLLTKLQA